MKYYLIVGEASGDLHASHLMSQLKELDRDAQFRFFGGEKMAAVGGTMVCHYRRLAYMGFIPVLLHLKTILRGMRLCQQDIVEWQPDRVVLVDYPGFNLKIAGFLKKYYDTHPGQKRPLVDYYISPKIWAWKEGRIHAIRQSVDHVLSILPFEVDWFRDRHNYHVDYVGNPTLDEVQEYCDSHPMDVKVFCQEHSLSGNPVIALLPGSRMQEIEGNLGRMLEASDGLAGYQRVLVAAPNIDIDVYSRIIGNRDVAVLQVPAFQVLQHSVAALVTSGTATLETALLGVPQVVCYWMRWGRLVSMLRPLMLKIPYVSLVNLIAGSEVVRELVAKDMTVSNVRTCLLSILPGGKDREQVLAGYDLVRQRLGSTGAAAVAARYVMSYPTAGE